MSSESPRYFENRMAVDSQGLSLEALKTMMLERIKIVFESDHECRGGLYVGAGGVCYAYLHIREGLSETERQYFEPIAEKLLMSHLHRLEKKGVTHENDPGFLHGKAGLDAVACVFGRITGNKGLEELSARSYAQAASLYDEFRGYGEDELFMGRGGFLLGALWLQEHLGYCPVSQESLRKIWKTTIESGQRYARDYRTKCSLMYVYHDKEYLGAAHGLSAILQVLMSYPTFLKENPEATADIKATVDYYLSLRDADGNYPSSTEKSGTFPLVHWCHGAPGAIFMFAKAYLVFGDQKYLEACISSSELIWQKGLLKKGPGICHGVAGNGYAFLILNRLLEDVTGSSYLRAKKFAEFLNSREFIEQARTPDRPYSLFEGLAGTVCFLNDLMFPDKASFPFFNVFYNYTLVESLI